MQRTPNKQCDKLVKESRVLNWKRNPVLRKRDGLVNLEGKWPTVQWKMKTREPSSVINVINVQTSMLYIVLGLGLFLYPTLFYALLNWHFKCRARQPNKMTFYFTVISGVIKPTFSFLLYIRSQFLVCSPVCLSLSELDSLFNPTSNFLSPTYHTAC